MLLANEEMMAETRGHGGLSALGTVSNGMLTFVDAAGLSRHGSGQSYQRCLPPLAVEGFAGFLYLCAIFAFLSSVIKCCRNMTDAACVLFVDFLLMRSSDTLDLMSVRIP